MSPRGERATHHPRFCGGSTPETLHAGWVAVSPYAPARPATGDAAQGRPVGAAGEGYDPQRVPAPGLRAGRARREQAVGQGAPGEARAYGANAGPGTRGAGAFSPDTAAHPLALASPRSRHGPVARLGRSTTGPGDLQAEGRALAPRGRANVRHRPVGDGDG